MSETAKLSYVRFAIFKTCRLQLNGLVLLSFNGSIYMHLGSIFLDCKRDFFFKKKKKKKNSVVANALLGT